MFDFIMINIIEPIVHFILDISNNEYVKYRGNKKRFICAFKKHSWIFDNNDPDRDMWGWGTCSRCNRRENL